MRIYRLYLYLFLALTVSALWGQTDFRAGLEQNDPIPKDTSLDLETKLETHQDFLEKAIADSDTLAQLYGHLYLAADHSKAQDFAEATRFLLRAEAIAEAARNPGWQGWVTYRRGAVEVRLKRWEEALKFYETAMELCAGGGDSLCLAESMEQASVMHGLLDDFENAFRLNDEAMPLLEKYGREKQLATALSNFGIILNLSKRYSEAIPFFERAIELHGKLGNKNGAAKAMNNLANVYRNLGRYDQALSTFLRCVGHNLEFDFQENLLHNYIGIGLTYDSLGDFRASRIYFEKYEVLKDSLIGAETQQKIAELEIKYETQQKELELERSKAALLTARNLVERRNILLGVLLLLGLFALGWWRWQSRMMEKERVNNLQNLNKLTQVLQRKNKQLSQMEKKLSEQTCPEAATSDDEDFQDNLYAHQILTNDDWTTFKGYYEKTYPGYILRLRNAFPALTEAEERLFLLLKLQLNTKEIADMLGISAESVKRTRNRLRKRLELDESAILNGFVREF